MKLIFAFQSDDPNAPRAERMWVTIDSISGSTFVGTLDNEPRYIADLKMGDRIEFDERHIIDTDLKDPVPSIVDKYAARCFVTRHVLEEGHRVGYLYREQPDNEKDSGWRILAGDETEEYMDEPENTKLVSLGAVLRVDDSIVAILDSPIGAVFQRNVESGKFERVSEDSG